MHNHFKTICKLVCFTCLFSLSWGCARQNESSEKTGMIRKKIAHTDNLSQPEKIYASPVPETWDDNSVEKLISAISRTDQSDKAGIYNPEGKTDPFVPLFQIPTEESPPVTQKPGKPNAKSLPQCSSATPLVQIGLSQLKLVGIIQAASGDRALVQEASDKGYVVKKDTCIGIHSGRVSKILNDRIIIEEKFEDYEPGADGNWKPIVIIRERELKLQNRLGI